MPLYVTVLLPVTYNDMQSDVLNVYMSLTACPCMSLAAACCAAAGGFRQQCSARFDTSLVCHRMSLRNCLCCAAAVASPQHKQPTTKQWRASSGTLDKLDAHLETSRYLWEQVSLSSDVRLFTTLVRFDVAYHGLFKCSKQKIEEYCNLSLYLRDLYQTPGVAETCDIANVGRTTMGHCSHSTRGDGACHCRGVCSLLRSCGLTAGRAVQQACSGRRLSLQHSDRLVPTVTGAWRTVTIA